MRTDSHDDNDRLEVGRDRLKAAADAARAAVAAAPRDPEAARALFVAVREYRDRFPQPTRAQEPTPSELGESRRLIRAKDHESAEVILREYLAKHPDEPSAMHMMAEIAAYCGLSEDSQRILRYSAQIHANDPDALASLGSTLNRVAIHEDLPELIFRAAEVFDRALAIDPQHEQALSLKAQMMMQTRGLNQAREAYDKLVSLYPHVAQHWLNYGSLLKPLGETGQAVAAIRTALALEPGNGSWWWTLSDLRTARLFDGDIAQMEEALDRADLPDGQRVQLHFALATAYDAAGEFERAIGHIERGSAFRATLDKTQQKPLVADSAFIRRTFTKQFFDDRKDWGDHRKGPIFILGMHRAGSTLVEQILSSHSQIEGSEELFIITRFASEIGRESSDGDQSAVIEALRNHDFQRFGERYFELSSRSRNTDRPFLTDKYPGNWKFVGLIHCMLPNSRIIDVRRNPMDCCFANYFRYYSTASDHSFSQEGMGRYYADYVAAMRHFDAVLPGRVHRIIHDDLVDDLDREVRRLLDYIGVPFEENCLQFFETKRAVHTPSSEQVRQPINRKGFGRWQRYEPWLGDMKAALGNTIDSWRG